MSGIIGDNLGRSSGLTKAVSAGISWQSVTTGTTLTAVAGRGYPINTTSNVCTVTLPTSASVGDEIIFTDYARTWSSNSVTLSSSLNFQGSSAINPVYDTAGETIHIVYMDVTKGWIPKHDGTVVWETDPVYDIEWLVIGSGASGATGYRSGGGGAGGYRNSYASEQSGRLSAGETAWVDQTAGDGAITVTIGVGAQSPAAGNFGTAGNTSSIAAAGETTVTCYGGGGGGHMLGANGAAPTGTFGSGGGAGDSNGIAAQGGPSTAGQGFDGGDTIHSAGHSQGAGGGGAGEIGNDGDTGTTDEMDGGDGMASSITGASVYRAAGGGGGGYSGVYGDGGNGGGGDGGVGSSAPAAYPDNGVPTGSPAYNSGAGGGAGANQDVGSGGFGDGDDGVVFLRMPTSGYSTTTSGSPTVITDGADTILVFEATGSYTR